MTIKEKIMGTVAVISPKGDLVSEAETSLLKDKINSLTADKLKNVVLDLGGVEFINSSGLGTLISALTRVRNGGGDLRLARLGERVQNLFVITKLVSVFESFETVDRAVASFNGQA